MNIALQDEPTGALATRGERTPAYRALVVEDNPSDQYMMQRMLLNLGLEAQIAGTGDDAMQLARSIRPDIVFLDVILPEQTGYSLAGRIRALYPDSHIPVVFVTALGDDDVILRCFSAGGDDVITKPVEPAILSARTEAALRSRRLHEMLAGQRDQLLVFQNEIGRDVDVTKTILDNCSTAEALAAPNVRFLMRPVETLNGDFIMAARKPSRGQCFIVGDFTGHGLPAAVGVMIVHGVFCAMVAKGFDIVTIAHEINRKMHTLLPTNRFLSAALFEIDPQSNIMSVWNAGLPPLLVRGDERRISAQFPSSALPLGILPPHEFTARASHIVLSPDDRVYAYSDGIVEAADHGGEMFGQERLQAALESDAEDALGQLVASLESFTAGKPPHDDLSCLEV
ncbi:MAG: SpoIIE family protein phosphatase, partial [Gammaproteobacteria bacterium]